MLPGRVVVIVASAWRAADLELDFNIVPYDADEGLLD